MKFIRPEGIHYKWMFIFTPSALPLFNTQPILKGEIEAHEKETSMQLRGKEVNYLYQNFIAFTNEKLHVNEEEKLISEKEDVSFPPFSLQVVQLLESRGDFSRREIV